jgi:hypothetical protein
MPIDLGTVRYAVLVADADTPPALLKWAGTPVPIPDGVELPTTLDSITFNEQTFWGYARVNDATGNTEWVLAKPQNINLQALDTLPGPSGWIVAESRGAMRQIGKALLDRGVSGADLRQAMQAAWSAIVAERDAQILALGGTLTGPPPETP